MIVTLIKQNEIYEQMLPDKVVGKYWLYDTYENKKRELISIESIENHWNIVSNLNASIIGDGNVLVQSIELKTQTLYKLKIVEESNPSFIYCSDLNKNTQVFTKFIAPNNTNITIGNSNDNVIQYSSPLFNGTVASLIKKDAWELNVTGSFDVVYVNEVKVSNTVKLKPCDIVYILGLKIVVGDEYLAINNPNNMVKYNTSILREVLLQQEDENIIPPLMNNKNLSFTRSPRYIKKFEPVKIKIDSPPNKNDQRDAPIILTVGPSLMMAMSSVVTSTTSILAMNKNQRNFLTVFPSLLMCGSMVVTSVLFPVLTRKFTLKTQKKDEEKRKNKYIEYLNKKDDEIKLKIKEQKKALSASYRSFDQLEQIINNKTIDLWSKSKGNYDYLSFFAGVGDVPADIQIDADEAKFSIEDDILIDKLQQLKHQKKLIENSPVYYSLKKNWLTGVTGDKNAIFRLIQNSLLEICTMHGYDEVKIVLITNEVEYKFWKNVRWLPHCWDNYKRIRFIASSNSDLSNISDYFAKLFDETNIFDKQNKEKKLKENYIVIFTDKNMYDQAEFVKKIVDFPRYVGISILTLFGNYSLLPRECISILDVQMEHASIYNKDSNELLQFKPNVGIYGNYNEAFKQLDNIELKMPTISGELPDSISFLDMYKVGKIEYLNVLSRWAENDPTTSLKAPVGVNSHGELFYIDLHEKYHGPHGLIAGGTGSGKSEFIITFILSLAVNYHPNDVSFVLIDYKGGGLTGAFEIGDSGKKLPHLSGTITNLSGSSIKRCIVSIKSELQRRQRLFNEARKVSGEGTIDIYKYQRLRKQGIVTEPIPHLYIISDEFAELKTQQPEFMEELVSTARIGRSLGVHLILATQKPAGVVDEQIWTNSKFRVCLKVQDKQDSQDMIRRPDAADIIQTGRFYFQVGYNELFAMGQSAWSGADYIPKETVNEDSNFCIKLIDNVGNVNMEVKPDTTVQTSEKPSQQVVEIVKHLADIAEEEGIKPISLWMEPLPSSILIEKLIKKYKYKNDDKLLNPIIGEYDDPSTQSQNILTMPISKYGNTVIYGATGSGKTTLLSTITYSMIDNVSAENLNIYIIDFGTGSLKMFDGAPQVGDVILQEDTDKIENLFKMLNQAISERKKLFAPYGGELNNYLLRSKKSIPRILVYINNYDVFADEYEMLVEEMKNLLRDGLKYGISFVLTVSNANAINYSLIQNIKMIYSLQMNNPEDYSAIFGRTDGLVPSSVPGRGLFKLEDTLYEFQTALVSYSSDIMKTVSDKCEELSKVTKVFAKKVSVLPEKVSHSYFKDTKISINNVPVGVNKEGLYTQYINLNNNVCNFVFAEILKNTNSFVKELVGLISKISGVYPFVFDLGNKLDINSTEKIYMANINNYSSRLKYVYDEYQKRVQKYLQEPKLMDKSFNMVCVLYGFSTIKENLQEMEKVYLDELLNCDKAKYKISILIIDIANSVSDYNFEPWYTKSVTESPMLWIGRGLTEQYQIKVNGNPKNEILNNFGYFIEDGNPALTKVLEYEKEKDETLDF